MYQSKAVLRRKRKRIEYLKKRNAVVFFGGIVLMGVVGICLGLWIVQELMPDHQWFNRS